MEITRETDYTLRMLVDLVRNPGQVLSLRVVAERNGIPYSFARSIQRDLVRAGIVESVRGSHGGMYLAVDPDKTSLLSIIEYAQGPIPTFDEGAKDPDIARQRPFDAVFAKANEMVREYLGSIPLSDAAKGLDT